MESSTSKMLNCEDKIRLIEKEITLKREKTRTKANFTRSKNIVMAQIEEEFERAVIKGDLEKMDQAMDNAVKVMDNLADLYMKIGELDKSRAVISEMEKLGEEYTKTSEAVVEYLDTIRSETASKVSEELSLKTVSKLYISKKPQEVDDIPRPRQQNIPSMWSNWAGFENQPPEAQHSQSANETETLQSGAQFEVLTNYIDPSIGQDLWRQLKRVEIPVFSGDKRVYQSWKAAFLACIDKAPATGEYKLLQLRQYLSGEALKIIENLGHSAAAYEAAKERLDRKYGGRRRQIAIYLEELEQFGQVRPGKAKDLEEFADLLDVAIINLQEADQHHELGNGSLYTKLQRKLPESLLARYHRWIFEKQKPESVMSLRTWVIQEAEFQIIASETVHGLSAQSAQGSQSPPGTRYRHQRTFFGGENYESKPQRLYCKICENRHGVWSCPEFMQYSVSDRWSTAKRYQLCYRCLGTNHIGRFCTRSRKCGQNECEELHHKLLHRDNPVQGNGFPATRTNLRSEVDSQTSADIPESPIHSSMEGNAQRTMMTQNKLRAGYIGLRTVPVILTNGSRSITVNALLDDASTKTYINADVAAELGCKGRTEKVTVNVLNGQVETFETRPVEFELRSITGGTSMIVSAYTAKRVTGSMPTLDWNMYKQQWPHLRDIVFPNSSTRPIVDILIGLDCADLHYALEERRGRPGEPMARLTPLGWTCIGNPTPTSQNMLQTNFSATYFARDVSEIQDLNKTLKRFWEVESEPVFDMPIVRMDDQQALLKVGESCTYEKNMYRVGIPWKDKKPTLPNNYKTAMQRLENTEKRLKRSPDIAKSYNDCIEKYIEKGYITKVPEHEESKSKWFLPHFPVLRPEKDTTKTRIVFDAAAKCEGVSLNDMIHQGPKLQRDLFDVLLRFRRLPIAVVCDIAEMYLRIGIADADKPYHRFLWRGMAYHRNPDVYEFDRVVFGVNSSPFQAQYVLQQHAKQHQNSFPKAAETVLKSTYMDDSMDSVLNVEQAKELYKELSTLLTNAGMHARKWLSNCSEVLKGIPISDRKSEVDLDKEQLPSVKTLGVWWLADQDVFTFKANVPDEEMTYTKRNFLKKIATLFDPIGLLSPFTIRAKMLLQDMWTAGLEWDDEMDEQLANSARMWFSQLHVLKELQIPRCLQEKGKAVDNLSLHTFVDASENAYGAVVYARCVHQDGYISMNIVAAKTKVAPSLATSIPRLELMGAVVGIRLTKRIATVLGAQLSTSTFWSDSANVLWWIRGRSRRFKPFVANRVGEIQTDSNPEQWRYVPTNLNPADFLSRGMMAEDLIKCEEWWNGPAFLLQPHENWPKNTVVDKPTSKLELKSSEVDSEVPRSFFTTTDMTCAIEPLRFSSWLKLRRVTAWVIRFVTNCQKSSNERIYGELHAEEIKAAEIHIIREAQQANFRDEWIALAQGKPLSSGSKLLGLKPRLDDDQMMRSDGRLVNARFLSFDIRYPVILPRKSWVTKLIIKDAHENSNHAAGTNHTLSTLSARYWIVSGREVIREVENECMECRRRKAKGCKQIMAPLPLDRLKTSIRAFTTTAVDFGGPFITVQGRGIRRQKRYLCLFTCMATRAVHLEIAFGLDTDSFLNAFYRMVSRRGLPEAVYSDNATNFKGANNELKSLVEQLDGDQIQQSGANKGVKWHFNPPLAPHFGGVHESMIKSAKRAINAILGNADITDEELITAIVGAEGLINSRPLTYQSSNPSDDVPLTPNHFLHGQIGGQFAPASVDETQFSLRKRWRRIQELVRHFWHRWLREWLPTLGARKKWLHPERDIKTGEIVLVISPDTSRGNWPLGRVLEVFPGQDGRVRVVKLQVGNSTMTRPITKICSLELDS